MPGKTNSWEAAKCNIGIGTWHKAAEQQLNVILV
jgi:hypothetical protein